MIFRRFLALAILLLVSVKAVADETTVFEVDFAEQSDMSAPDWLADKGFVLNEDADDSDEMEITRSDDGLTIRTTQPAFGLILHEGDIPGATKLRLHWGVSHYPAGASYESGVDDEAILVYVFFGHEKFSSGSVFIPDSPYFIGFFLCESDVLEKPYTGRYFEKAGRYRGYDFAEVVGDYGVNGTLELSHQILRPGEFIWGITPFLFLDAGYTFAGLRAQWQHDSWYPGVRAAIYASSPDAFDFGGKRNAHSFPGAYIPAAGTNLNRPEGRPAIRRRDPNFRTY